MTSLDSRFATALSFATEFRRDHMRKGTAVPYVGRSERVAQVSDSLSLRGLRNSDQSHVWRSIASKVAACAPGWRATRRRYAAGASSR